MAVSNATRWAQLWLLLYLIAFFAKTTTAESWISKRTEQEEQWPYCCPEGCGGWCDDAAGCENDDGDGNGNGDEDSDGLNSFAVRDIPLSGACGFDSANSTDDTCSHAHDLDHRGLVTRQADRDILEDGLTDAGSWSAGRNDWYNKMRGIITSTGLRFCYHAGSTAITNYFDASLNGMPRRSHDLQGMGGGSPPVRGCTVFVGASNLGVVVAHIWEVPTFALPGINPQTGEREWDHEGQREGYRKHVTLFLERGFQRYPDKPGKPSVPDSPAIADLVKPGMILDKHSTQWRHFRTFHAYNSARGPPSRAPIKNPQSMARFRADIAAALGVSEDEVVRHSPLYEPHPDTGAPWSPDPWFNLFTWQFAPSSPDPTDDGKEKHAFRATWHGTEIAEMKVHWDPIEEFQAVGSSDPVGRDELCRLEVRYQATPADESADDDDDGYLKVESVKIFHPDGRASHEDSGRFDLDRSEGWTIWRRDSGLEETVRFWFTGDNGDEWGEREGNMPAYDSWHISAYFGETQQYLYKGDATTRRPGTLPICRGGSWRNPDPDANSRWERTANCIFWCTPND